MSRRTMGRSRAVRRRFLAPGALRAARETGGGSELGVNAGAGLTFMLKDHAGFGGLVRYSSLRLRLALTATGGRLRF